MLGFFAEAPRAEAADRSRSRKTEKTLNMVRPVSSVPILAEALIFISGLYWHKVRCIVRIALAFVLCIGRIEVDRTGKDSVRRIARELFQIGGISSCREFIEINMGADNHIRRLA